MVALLRFHLINVVPSMIDARICTMPKMSSSNKAPLFAIKNVNIKLTA